MNQPQMPPMPAVPSMPGGVPDLGALAREAQLAPPVPRPTVLGIQDKDGNAVEYGIDKIREMSEDDYRLFMLVLASGNVDDPEFQRRFGPNAEASPQNEVNGQDSVEHRVRVALDALEESGEPLTDSQAHRVLRAVRGED